MEHHPICQKYLDGQLIRIDKALEWTSFDVVNKLRFSIRKHLGIKKIKIGHAGTLDPLATGLLLLCSGRMTKQIDTIQGLEKEYTGTFTIGATTASYDLESPITDKQSIDHVTDEMIANAVKSFLGEIDQVPPTFSAVKVDGQRAYELARQGIDAKIKAKRVNIQEFEIERIEKDILRFRIVCSKGTYIRSIARDLGEALKCGAYISELRRTRIGDYLVSNAITVDEMIEILEKEGKQLTEANN